MLGEDRADHFTIGIQYRELGGKLVSEPYLRRFLPPRLEFVAFRHGYSLVSVERLLQFRSQIVSAELPDWTVLTRDEFLDAGLTIGGFATSGFIASADCPIMAAGVTLNSFRVRRQPYLRATGLLEGVQSLPMLALVFLQFDDTGRYRRNLRAVTTPASGRIDLATLPPWAVTEDNIDFGTVVLAIHEDQTNGGTPCSLSSREIMERFSASQIES